VFLSHHHRDSERAAELSRVLCSYGLEVFTDRDANGSKSAEDALWDAMAESQALVAVIPEGEPSPTMLVELGAARAWNKPSYGIVFDPASTRLPPPLHGLTVYPRSRIDEVAQEIKRSSELLSDAETASLIDEYHRIGMSVDQLVLQPAKLARLTRQFKVRTKRQIAGEQLVHILLRMRKARALPGMRKRQSKAS